MSSPVYLGIDLGTSEVKALLLDQSHAILATHGEPLTLQRPAPGNSEQDPAAWWDATVRALVALRGRAPGAWDRVAAIGLSGQMHGAVLLDGDGQVLRPAILWNDGRSAVQCEELLRRCPELPAIAGNLAMPGFTAPKLLWVAEHEPEIFRRVATVLLPKDWIRWRLTGEFVSEPSDAAGTLWLDVAKRDWSDALLAATGLTRAHMPRLVEGSQVSARLSAEAARTLALPAGLPVAGGGGDNAASAVGMGAVTPGEGFVSLGTSGVVFVSNDRFQPNPSSGLHAFCHAVPGRWHQMGVMLSAAAGLAWLARILKNGDEAALLARAEALTPEQRAAAPIFLPYLSGERTPHNDVNARGVFFGLDNDTDPALLAWSVIEGVAFGLRDGLDAIAEAGERPRRLALVGGGARSALWAALIADVLDLEIRTFEGGEAGGALGAARLAWLADGGAEAEVCREPAVRDVYRPRVAHQRWLKGRRARYRDLYAALKPLFPPIA